MNSLITAEHQPGFPAEDLTDSNAAILEILLANLMVVEERHLATERVSWAYTVGHPSILKAATTMYEGDHSSAIDHGVKVFESMVSFVATPSDRLAPFAAEKAAIQLLKGHEDREDLWHYAIDVTDDMKQSVPRTAEVVSSASERFFGKLTSYALLGAALSRQFELDCISSDGI